MSWALTRGTGKFSTLPMILTVTQNGNLLDFTWGNEFRFRGLPNHDGGGSEQCAGERYVSGSWVDAGIYEVTYTVERKEGSDTVKMMDGAAERILPPASVHLHDGDADDPLSGTWGAEGSGVPPAWTA